MGTQFLSLLIAAAALCISAFALVVAILDWHQVGREEPWKLTKLDPDIWLLERVHRSPAVIVSLLNFHGSPVEVLNDAAMPVGVFRRGRKEVLCIEGSQIGTFLTVSSRRGRGKLLRRLLGEQKAAWTESGHYANGKGVQRWTTPIY